MKKVFAHNKILHDLFLKKKKKKKSYMIFTTTLI